MIFPKKKKGLVFEDIKPYIMKVYRDSVIVHHKNIIAFDRYGNKKLIPYMRKYITNHTNNKNRYKHNNSKGTV